MNLTSKRVIAALLIAAAFSGVLLKELPWQSGEGKKSQEDLSVAQVSLGDRQLLAQGETQSDVIDQTLPEEAKNKPQQIVPFAGVSGLKVGLSSEGASPDKPSPAKGAKLPDPVATIASHDPVTEVPAPFEPLLGGRSSVPIGGGLGGGGNPGGGGGGGGNGGGGGAGGGGGNNGGNPSNPSDNPKPNSPTDNVTPPTNPDIHAPADLPKKGNDTVVPPKNDDPVDPFTPKDPAPTIDLPNDPINQPNPPTNPLPDDPLLPPGGDGPGDNPDLPPNEPSHSVPDAGSSIALLGLALVGLGAASRKFRKA